MEKQKLFEKQQQVEDEARREKDRLDELRKKEQERILEVGLGICMCFGTK